MKKMDSSRHLQKIQEFGITYEINLSDYLDTGLFLDAREIRKFVLKEISQEMNYLNLYSYTCSIGLCAASKGATGINVDLSNTYLKWGKKKLRTRRHKPGRPQIYSRRW